MYCNKCGNLISDNQKYCNKCGNLVNYNPKLCSKCGNIISENQKYCNKCGNLIDYKYNNVRVTVKKTKVNNLNKNNLLVGVGIFIIVLVLIFSIVFVKRKINKYIENAISQTTQKSDNTPNNNTPNTNNSTQKSRTTIIADNTYTGLSIKNVNDAKNIIVQDSVMQKEGDYSNEIITIENSIISKYNITAVNLKEMNVEFAKELENVIGDIYNNYPEAREYLTNLTLTNLSIQDINTIALFMPIFLFGMSSTSTTRPWIIKTQIQLNASYFLNTERIEASTEASSKAGWFPPNATRYSAVAHEMGHYISFIALLKYYKMDSLLLIDENNMNTYYDCAKDFSLGKFSKLMLDKAYEKYINDYGKIDFNEWRGQISNYALAKDSSGDYIYDETVAEAFHDVYLNGNNASLPSKYIVDVLKKYLSM